MTNVLSLSIVCLATSSMMVFVEHVLIFNVFNFINLFF